MASRQVDVAVIGGGSAGMVAWRQARRHAERVVLIEAERFGTTCARVGCMPSKLLIAAAEAAHNARSAGLFGVAAGELRIDGRAVMARVRAERDQFVAGVLRTIEGIPAEDRILARARFIAPGRLALSDGQEITAERIVIATGSRPRIVSFLAEAGERLITSDQVFDWGDLPESVAVFGSGVIGLELGQALSRLGVRVRLFGVGGRIGGIRDPEIRALALRCFTDEFPLDPDATIHEIRGGDDGVLIRFDDHSGRELSERFDWLLAATGRRANVDELGLEHSGLALDERGIPSFDRYTLQCGDRPVFIAGDVNGERPLLHEAADEGRIAGANAGRWPDVRSGLRRAPLAVVFSDPQVASVGLSLAEVDERCQGCFAVGSIDFAKQGRSRIMGRNRGLLRLYAEHGSGLFLGAEMFGPAAEHIAHLLAWSVQARLTVTQMLDMPFYHPVIEEGLRSALQDLNHQLKAGPKRPQDCMDCGPGT